MFSLKYFIILFYKVNILKCPLPSKALYIPYLLLNIPLFPNITIQSLNDFLSVRHRIELLYQYRLNTNSR